MASVFKSSKPGRMLIPVGSLLLSIAIATGAGVSMAHAKSLSHNNLFSLLGSLNGTTTQILTHTKDLNHQVEQVSSQLETLQKQSNILSEQTKTGQQLQSQLDIQIKLTTQNVNTMRQILQAESNTAKGAASVSAESNKLASVIGQNEQTLASLATSLTSANQQSNDLYQQMGSLIQGLQTSEQTFHAFGQVNSLLSKKAALPQLGQSAQSTLGKAGSAVGSLLNSTIPSGQNSTSSPQTNSSTSNGTNSTQSGLGGLLGVLG